MKSCLYLFYLYFNKLNSLTIDLRKDKKKKYRGGISRILNFVGYR